MNTHTKRFAASALVALLALSLSPTPIAPAAADEHPPVKCIGYWNEKTGLFDEIRGVGVPFTTPCRNFNDAVAPTGKIWAGLQLDDNRDGMGDDWQVANGAIGLVAGIDSDGDGLRNIEEFYWLSNPLVADSDGDGWSDGDEARYWSQGTGNKGGTLPGWGTQYAYPGPFAFYDTDGDRLPNILDADSDEDGLQDGPEALVHDTMPELADTDGDGLIDGGITPLLEERIIGEVYDVGSDPTLADSDGDGLTDRDEYEHWTRTRGYSGTKTLDTDGDGAINIRDPDSDGDGALDGTEVQFNTRADRPDTDGDKLPDGWEIRYNQAATTSSATQDTDADGATAEEEYCYGITLTACRTWNYYAAQDYYRGGTIPNDADTDNDLLLDGEEFDEGTNPHHWDTDMDGMPDEYELQYGFNPLNAADAAQDADNDFFDQNRDGIPEQVHSNLAEYQYGRPAGHDESIDGPWQLGTLPTDFDTDDDGSWDAQEVYFGTNARIPADLASDDDMDGLNWTAEANLGTDPNDPDTDGDGLCDGGRAPACGIPGIGGAGAPGEMDYGSSPWDTDTDGDGLSDGTEARIWDPQASGVDRDVDGDLLGGIIDADNDGDDLIDGAENQAASPFMDVPDSDGDGLLDGAEVHNYLTNPSSVDTDGDGLTDGEEVNQFETKPLNADSDLDGLLDGAEVHTHGTNPLKADTDDDTLPDAWEVNEGTQPLVPDSDVDVDGDGLSNLAEYQFGSSPVLTDTDADTLPDGWEHQYALNPRTASQNQDTDGDGSLNGAEFRAGTNPRDPDSDDDGLTDGDEATHGTLPLNEDSDADRLLDGAEVHTYGTKPLDPDTDRDGLSDSEEVFSTRTDPRDADSDNDGLTDHDEVVVYQGKYDPNDYDTDNNGRSDGTEVALADPQGDFDNDGLSNSAEDNTYGTDPTRADSDCDGAVDGSEVTYWKGAGYSLSTYRAYLWNQDVDGDGIKDGVEIGTVGSGGQVLYQTRPDSVDTDGDGLLDNQEATNNVRAECATGASSMSAALPEPVPGVSLNEALRDASGLVPGVLYEAPNGLVFGVDEHGVYIQGGYGVRLYPMDVDASGLLEPQATTMAAGTNGQLTNPVRPDTDGDGLTDGEEQFTYGTDPLLCDTDRDGLGDGLEKGRTAYISPRQGGVCDQRDRDTSTTTDPRSVDSDGDGLADGPTISINGRSIQGEDSNANGKLDPGAWEGDPTSTDSDSDGLRDDVEFNVLGTIQCVANPDCDGDTLLDGAEVSWNLDSDADGRLNFVDADSDNDGVPDGLEGRFLSVTAYKLDSDGDGLKNMVDPDSDNDGFKDGVEDKAPFGVLGPLDLNPLNPDMDGDGVIDGLDINPVSGLPILGLDLGKLVVLDPVDCCWPTHQAEVYVGRIWVTTDRAGANVVFNVPLDNTVNGFDGNDYQTNKDGHIGNFAAPLNIDVPQDVSLYSPDIANRDVKMYLWMTLWDLDLDNHDQLDVGGKATPMWGDAGKAYMREISLRQDLYKTWRGITDINGNLDGSSGSSGKNDEDDTRLDATFEERSPMAYVTQLIKESQFV